jgi:hypothetical protein
MVCAKLVAMCCVVSFLQGVVPTCVLKAALEDRKQNFVALLVHTFFLNKNKNY